jgi:hypothetical protein
MNPHARLLGLVTLAVMACSRTPRLDTRTFELRHLSGNEVAEMLSPYIWVDRPGAPGRMSFSGNTFTVRETPDNLAKIEQVLAEFDRPRPAVQLHFRIIQADGTTRADPAIADVEAVLRQLFRFSGYRLIAEAMTGGNEYSDFSQTAREGEDNFYTIRGVVRKIRTSGDSGSVELTVRLEQAAPAWTLLETTVNLRAGQTAVLGNAQATRGAGGGTLILTVRPELVRS